MNHVLKKVSNIDENVKAYQDPSFVLHDELIEFIVQFVSEINP